jgi:coenzyme F420-reducing hydrogenase delta subunit
LARKKAKGTQGEKIVVFACHRRIEMAVRDGEKIDPRIIPVPCIGRLNPGIIVKCIEQGARGVFAVGCGEKDCRFESGYLKGMAAFAVARKVAKTLGLDRDTIQLSSEPSMQKAIDEFSKRVRGEK